MLKAWSDCVQRIRGNAGLAEYGLDARVRIQQVDSSVPFEIKHAVKVESVIHDPSRFEICILHGAVTHGARYALNALCILE